MSSFLGLFARTTLGWVFGAALFSKLLRRASWRAFVDALPALGLPDRVPARFAAGAVVAGEAGVLVTLVASPRLGAALCTGVLAAFTLVLALAVRGHRRAACHCFGSSDTPVGGIHIVRNALLLAISGALLATGTDGPPVALSATAATAVGYGAVLGFLMTRWDDLAFLAGADPVPAAHLEPEPSASAAAAGGS